MAEYFTNIIGNEILKCTLSNYIKNNSLPHAFIIEGPYGSGRKLFAKSIVAAISCKNSNGSVIPCGKCINCEKIQHEVCPDVILIDSYQKQSISVETIRELNSHTYMTPNELDLKAYIINDADKMTLAAQNAFLKTLEEPVTNVLYFLICENSSSLLPTVISRAPVIRTSPLKNKEIKSYLLSNYDHIDAKRIDIISAITHGNMGLAELYASDTEKYDEILSKRDVIYKILDIIRNKESKYEMLLTLSDLNEKNSELIEMLRLLYCSMRDIIVYKETEKKELDFFVDSDDINKYVSTVKPKFAKKACIGIEKAISELYLNQGNSSTTSIMFTLACELWSAKS